MSQHGLKQLQRQSIGMFSKPGALRTQYSVGIRRQCSQFQLIAEKNHPHKAREVKCVRFCLFAQFRRFFWV